MSVRVSNLDRARASWGADLPDWVEILARECDATSQSHVSKRLDRSSAFVSLVLSNQYPRNLQVVEERVRGIYMQETVPCPLFGDLAVHKCQDNRTRVAKGDASPTLIQLRRHCPRCPRNPDAQIT